MTGSHIISDLIQELHASVEAASQFEGEMQMLAGYSRWPSLTDTLPLLLASTLILHTDELGQRRVCCGCSLSLR